LVHVLSLYRILLSIGTSTTDDLLASTSESNPRSPDPASNISAVLRRTLPAIRILSKWLGSQLDYIGRVDARLIARETRRGMKGGRDDGSHRGEDDVNAEDYDEDERAEGISIKSEELSQVLIRFWTVYSGFSNTLLQAFPSSLISDAKSDAIVWLEEDVDMLGFAPLKKGMKEGSEGQGIEIDKVGKDVHPNEEQLMRIRDIKKDAIGIAVNQVRFFLDLSSVFSSILTLELPSMTYRDLQYHSTIINSHLT
jgi:hypothetical protein